MKFATKAIRAGLEPDPETCAVMTPIYQTSTFVQESSGKNKGYEKTAQIYWMIWNRQLDKAHPSFAMLFKNLTFDTIFLANNNLSRYNGINRNSNRAVA